LAARSCGSTPSSGVAAGVGWGRANFVLAASSWGSRPSLLGTDVDEGVGAEVGVDAGAGDGFWVAQLGRPPVKMVRRCTVTRPKRATESRELTAGHKPCAVPPSKAVEYDLRAFPAE